jgi:HD-GYP domain-containing protein (c-di-GMP phosphodiesterase class II)
LQLAIEVAAAEHCALTEVEASRELAVVLALLGRVDEARPIMATAARELDRLKPAGASPDPILAGEYPAGVRARAELLGVLDPAALSHAERVAQGAAALARELGFDGDGRARVRLGGYLHELPEEQLGDAIGWDVRPAVGCHRERRDGSGPGRLRGDAIPIDAEIVGIVDAHDRGDVEPAAAAAWWRPEILSAFLRAQAAGG